MKPTGKTRVGAFALAATVFANAALGAVTVSLDRNRVSLGDTLRLTITATENEAISDKDLAPLLGDFEIMQRATSSNTSIVNGRVSQSRQMTIDLAPLQEGNLQIPSLRIGQSTTPPLTVAVGPASDTQLDGQTVIFEAEVDQHSVYVQGQVILTLRLQQAVNLDSRSISQLTLDNAFVKPLEQHAFQRTVDGRPWQVDEVRYAIFPEQSGSLEIPAQVFSGRVNQPRRSFFDLGGSGQLVRRSTSPITIDVLPKPGSFTAEDWLPARSLTLQESWSTPLDNLRVGESATRTVRIVGDGLQGAQLPPVLFTPTEGLKYYPDQPQISEQETASGLQGIRQDSAAVVPTRTGSYVIPEIRIPWWDTQSERLQYAVIPERRITVAAGEPAQIPLEQSATSPIADVSPGGPFAVTPAAAGDIRIWQIVSAVSSLGWILTLVYLWRRRTPDAPAIATAPATGERHKAFKRVLAACAANDPARARATVIEWSAATYPSAGIVSLGQVATLSTDEEFRRQLEILDASLYGAGNSDWMGGAMADCVRHLQALHNKAYSPATDTLPLYPQET